MTDEQRHAEILSLIKKYTQQHTVSKDVARDTLVREGIYTKEGKLHIEFGGDYRNKTYL